MARYYGRGNNSDGAYALDGSGNVSVTGSAVSTTYPDYDYVTIKYNPAGEQQCNSAGQEQWVEHYSGGATAVAVDSSANVWVTAALTIEYNSGDQQQWAVASGNGANAIALDGLGNVYVTGSPAAPFQHTAVWTGGEMIVCGGDNPSN